jgi:hypothetical protein
MAKGTRPAATAAAEPAEEPPGVRPGAFGFSVAVGLQESEFGGAGFANQQPAGAADHADHGRIRARRFSRVERRAVARGEIAGVEDVLEGHRQALQRACEGRELG